MRRHRWAARAGRALLLVLAVAPWLSCGGGGLTEPTTGTIEVTTSTSGTDPDADGYTLTLDDVEVQAIGVAASATLPDLTPGAHRVGLSGLAPNCTVPDGNPLTVTVVAGEVAAASLEVICEAPPPATGGVSVTTTTNGVAPDADGYTLTVDGDAGRPIAADGTVAISDLDAGEHQVGLGGVAANCTVAGANPRAVSVVAGGLVAVTFTVACDEPPPAAGTLTVTTATVGASSDPDGYTFSVSGGEAQPIGTSASVSVANVAAGATTVGLSGVADNCTVAAPNPRTVTVPAGDEVEVIFDITCAAGTGSIEITTTSTGGSPDPSGYTAAVDGAAPLAIGVNATRTVDDLSPGAHTVTLGGVADNCTVQGENPRAVSVVAGQTAAVSFAVSCVATTGSLTVTVAGLPDGVDAAVTVTGPQSFSETVSETETLAGLVPGDYTVSAANVSTGGTTFTPDPASRTATVTAGATVDVPVTYTSGAGPSLNLRIAGLNVTQSVQTFNNEVPLVAGRDALLRVVVLANQSNRVTPAVRVRLFEGATVVQTLTISAPSDTTPTGRIDGELSTTWNAVIPGARIRQGLAIAADVDPTNGIPEADEGDNAFPGGAARTLTVRAARPLEITLLPVRHAASQLTGDVTTNNRDQYLDLTRRVHPIPSYDARVHAVYTTTTTDPLLPDDANGAWNTVLSEVFAVRVAEGSDRDYYGVVKVDYASGLAGMGLVGFPAAIGYDHPADRARITAHELGHVWGRLHAPCGNPPGIDPSFPNPDGSTGRVGYDAIDGVLKPRTSPDIMSYCADPWIGDYTYNGVMEFRNNAAGTIAARAQPALVLWGRIVGGRAILEPSFHVVTRPVLPKRPGAYAVEGRAADGSRLFSVSFDPEEVADAKRSAAHFAFAVPLDSRTAERLEHLALTGPGIAAAAVSRAPAALRAAPAPAPTVALRGGGVAVRWDAAAHPMVLVRDAATGEVLSLARGGEVSVAATGGEVELVLSDGVRSRSMTARAR